MAIALQLQVGRCANDIEWAPFGLFETLAHVKPDDPREKNLNTTEHEYRDDEPRPAKERIAPGQDADDNNHRSNE